MKIRDILQRDPSRNPLINNGQARLSDDGSKRSKRELRGELEMFVCEGQYADGLERILRTFLDHRGRSSQRGAWVSGFFGSGKSHLLKMLGHLWANTEFRDGAKARSLVSGLPGGINALLRELDIAGRQAGGLFVAAGSLPSGDTDRVRCTILDILQRAAGLPEGYAQAQFCLWLHREGYHDAVCESLKIEGSSLDQEVNHLYVSGKIAKAVLGCNPGFAANEGEVRKAFQSQFPRITSDITTEQFLTAARDVLLLRAERRHLPCTLLVLDEVQQFIGTSEERSTLVTEVAEAVEKNLDSQVMIVGAGQSALSEVPRLKKLLDRFTITVNLAHADVERVTRKVLLTKNPSAFAKVAALLEKHDSEISRQLQGTKIGKRTEDQSTEADDYPLLPVRRRFWEECFRAIDDAGTHSQLRSQLRVIHDAVAKLADRPLGALIPGSFLYDALADTMISSGALPRDTFERIETEARYTGGLGKRICALVFLIGKLSRETGADCGVRASKAHLGDLLVEDLSADNDRFRTEVASALDGMAERGVLMQVDSEYRLLTPQGQDWNHAFNANRRRLRNDTAMVQFRRDELLQNAAHDLIPKQVEQGEAKVGRRILVHSGTTPPSKKLGGG